jgi:hypothetical protein
MARGWRLILLVAGKLVHGPKPIHEKIASGQTKRAANVGRQGSLIKSAWVIPLNLVLLSWAESGMGSDVRSVQNLNTSQLCVRLFCLFRVAASDSGFFADAFVPLHLSWPA